MPSKQKNNENSDKMHNQLTTSLPVLLLIIMLCYDVCHKAYRSEGVIHAFYYPAI